ncbi:FGFR1 oncogene partner [Schistosoma japonicum]|nr:FGFR1 oncogene partner [Schistosoma japonicum]KAH8867273.1 FGFR1 oncogene partner [Schistosoma japonicum]
MYTLDTMADEEINLKDALIRSLNEEGILPRLEAQLKAAVYLALEKHNYAEGISPSNQSIRSLWSTEDGLIIASLLVDFLNVMKLENTLNVLMHEAQMKHLDLFDSDKLRSLLTPERTSSNSPLLLNLVETLKHFRNLKLDDTDSSPSVSNNSRNKSSRIPVLQSRKTRYYSHELVLVSFLYGDAFHCSILKVIFLLFLLALYFLICFSNILSFACEILPENHQLKYLI